MKTKTTFLTALVAFAGGASLMAQVYSVNIVGYVNLECPSGFSMIANPLQGSANTLAALFPSAPENTSVYKFGGSGYVSASFVDGTWEGSAITVAPGEGVFFFNPLATTFTNTFVGEVVLNSTNSIPSGYSIRSSVVPQAGLLSTTLQFPVAENDNVFRWTGSGFVSSSYVDATWEGAGEPNVRVGESFFVQKVAGANWARSFAVGQ